MHSIQELCGNFFKGVQRPAAFAIVCFVFVNFIWSVILEAVETRGGGVLGLQTYGEVPLENLKSHPVPESNS